MKIIIRKAEHDYPGSNFHRVDLVLSNGASNPLFGVWREKDRAGTYYQSDTTAQTWKSLAAVKAYAEAVYIGVTP